MPSSGTSRSSDGAARLLADDVARRSYGKLVAYLAARDGNVEAAEDALAESFLSALSDWPKSGCPDSPEAWLLTAARRKIIDTARRRLRGETIAAELTLEFRNEERDEEIPDQRLALMFVCAHPLIEPASRAPLILQLVLGLNAKRIASAFLTSPAAMGKRLVRAKERIRQERIPFEIPPAEGLAERLNAVLEAIYAAFSEGWIDPVSADIERRDLTRESVVLARLLAEMLPNEPEALGLLALILYSHSRERARRGASNEYIPFDAQDPDRWDVSLILEAESLLRRAVSMGKIGRYQLEAALQSAHTLRRCTGRPDWQEVVDLYDGLLKLTNSAVVALNRALALTELHGPDAGLAAIENIGGSGLAEYQPFWAVRAELLFRAGDLDGAWHAYEMAIGLETDPAVRNFLQARQEERCPNHSFE